MIHILGKCLIIASSFCLFLIIITTIYIFYVVKHRSNNLGFVITIGQNIFKQKMLVPLLILVRFHLPFPVMLFVAILKRKSTEKEDNST